MPLASATESLLKLNEKPPERNRRSFHRHYRKLTLAAKILLGSAIVVGLFAICHFTYTAYNRANSYTDSNNVPDMKRAGVEPDESAALLEDPEVDMRVDASVAMLGVAFLLSSVVCYRRARRYRPRAPIRPVRPQ